MKIYFHTKPCTLIFIAALFITAKADLEATRCPSLGKWMNKLCYIQTLEFYSALELNELSSQEKTQRNLKCISLSERSQSEKATHYMIPNI